MEHRNEATRTEILAEVCRELLALANREDDTAATEASDVPYWSPIPASVNGHRAAAQTLRRAAHNLDTKLRAQARAQARAQVRAQAHVEVGARATASSGLARAS
jgi:hypothetical protein